MHVAVFFDHEQQTFRFDRLSRCVQSRSKRNSHGTVLRAAFKGNSMHILMHFLYELHVRRGVFCVAATDWYER